MTIENDLRLNIKEFLETAEENLGKKRFNSAINSYFKAIATLCDLKIYELKKILPKNHSERFFFLKTYFPPIYSIVNKLFNDYTKTYNLRMSEKDTINFKENVAKIRKLFNF